MPDARAAAFERVFRADHAALVAFCYRRVEDVELARDLAAEAFRVAWSRWDEPRRSDRAWLYGVARNLIGNEYARRRIRATSALEETEGGPSDLRSELRFDAVEVQAVLAALPDAQRDLLQLAYWDRLSAPEIAELLHTTTAAVWVRLTRARHAFAAAWQEPTAPAVTTSPRSTR